MSKRVVSVDYYSDLLCVWAYLAEIKLAELRRDFPDQVTLDYRFVSVFGSTKARVAERWSDRGGFAGYAEHVGKVVERFDHVSLHPDAWRTNIPAGSLGPHAFCKAAALLAAAGGIDRETKDTFEGRTPVEELGWRLRLALFRDSRDIGRLDVQIDVAEAMGLPATEIRARVEDGSAFAAVAEDYETASRLLVTGSPTFLLNEGRQKLYGNVGYRTIKANIQELLRDDHDIASWC